MRTIVVGFAVALFPTIAAANPCPEPPAGQSQLQAAAETLAAGESCYYDTTLTGGDLDFAGATAIQWTDSGAWRPAARELHWVGRAEGCNSKTRPFVHIIYDEATGISTLDVTEFNPCGHGYDHNTVDPATDTVYFRPFNSGTISGWDGAAWNALPPFPSPTNSAAALVFFPEMGPEGSLIVASRTVLRVFDGDAWSAIDLDPPIGGLHNVAEYNPVLGVVLFGGGNDALRVLYRLDPDGTTTQLGDAPLELGARGQRGGMLSVDPLSGRMLALEKSNGQWWELDVEADAWRQIDTPPDVSPIHTFQAPISTWGVIALFEDGGGQDDPARLWIYRHSPGEPPAPGDTGGDDGGTTGDGDTGADDPDGGSVGDGVEDEGGDGGQDATGSADAADGTGDGGQTGPSGSEATVATAESDRDPSGCSCRVERPTSAWLLLLVVGGPFTRRRRNSGGAGETQLRRAVGVLGRPTCR